MHEMSLCEGILQIIQEEAAKQHFSKVEHVHLQIGKLAGVEVSSLEFCFEVICKNTLADNAKLTIHGVPGVGVCNSCHQESVIAQRFSPCPVCGSRHITLKQGDEMQITHLEVA